MRKTSATGKKSVRLKYSIETHSSQLKHANPKPQPEKGRARERERERESEDPVE